jgi:hypothetical protein
VVQKPALRRLRRPYMPEAAGAALRRHAVAAVVVEVAAVGQRAPRNH